MFNNEQVKIKQNTNIMSNITFNRAHVLALLTNVKGSKPLAEVNDFKAAIKAIDRKNGGLTEVAYEQFKGDAEIVAAAKAQRAAVKTAAPKAEKTTKTVKAPKATKTAPDASAVITFLNAHAGVGDRLPKAEYTALKAQVGSMRDSKKGGLTTEAYAQFKGNKDVVAAASADRKAMLANAKQTVSKANKRSR